MAHRIEIIADDENQTGEAPIWDSANSRLIWVDIDNSLVYQFFPQSKEKSIISRGLNAAGVCLNRHGGLVFAGAAGIHLWRQENEFTTLADEFEGQRLIFNDILADPKGRIYAGTLYWGDNGMERTGRLYLIDTDRRVRVVEEGVRLSNGLAFSPDNRILYYADSASRSIVAYEVDPETGDLRNRRKLVDVPAEDGIPDGLTVDAEGFLWVAHWYGAQVVRYDPDGGVERRIRMPVAQVSSVAFGGMELTDLYVTSAGRYWPSDLVPPDFDSQRPMGGALYRIPLDIPGKPEHQAAFHVNSGGTEHAEDL